MIDPTSLSPQRILVTGATGQIGSELTLALRQKYGGDYVVAAGHTTSPNSLLANSGPFETLDILDREALSRIVEKYQINTIYHLVSLLSVKGEKYPDLAWQVNLTGLKNVLDVAREHKITKVFWPSSIAVFGPDTPKINTPQRTVLNPTTMYGLTKVAGELLCQYYFLKYGVDVRSARYPGIISYKTAPGGGATDWAVDMFIQALKSKHYNCFVREDTILPMMYMPDAITAAIQITEADASLIGHRPSYNLTAMSFSAGELAAIIKQQLPDFECVYQPDERQIIADSWPQTIDDTLARQDWGWNQKFNLDMMAKDMLANLSPVDKTVPESISAQ
ncbi:MAG: NAD-dependent epimerase/dehydratase family protein [Patescibacteria group bacterium]